MTRPNVLELAVLAVSTFLSCSGSSGTVFGQIDARLENGHTQVLSIDKSGEVAVLGEFPLFPGLDPKNARVGDNLVRFSNGNVLIRVPDESVTKRVRAWNDLAHLFDVLFVDAGTKTISTLLKDKGFNIKIVKSADDAGFVIQVKDNTCILRMLDSGGRIRMQAQYVFRSYPSLVSVSRKPTGYEILHETIDSEERFLLDEGRGEVSSLSYKEIDTSDGKH